MTKKTVSTGFGMSMAFYLKKCINWGNPLGEEQEEVLNNRKPMSNIFSFPIGTFEQKRPQHLKTASELMDVSWSTEDDTSDL